MSLTTNPSQENILIASDPQNQKLFISSNVIHSQSGCKTAMDLLLKTGIFSDISFTFTPKDYDSLRALIIRNDGQIVDEEMIQKAYDEADKKLKMETKRRYDLLPSFDHLNKMKISERDKLASFTYVPPTNRRNCVFLPGSSGSGKTYWTACYIKKYMEDNPNNMVHIFSKMGSEDPSFKILNLQSPKLKMWDVLKKEESQEEEKTKKGNKKRKLNKIKRVYSILKEDLTIHQDSFKKCLVVMDDLEYLGKDAKEVSDYLECFMNEILNAGRKTETSLVAIHHKPCDGEYTKHLMLESHVFVTFPAYGANSGALDRLFEVYLGPKFGKDIKRRVEYYGSISRWVAISIDPERISAFILHQFGCELV